MRSQRGRVLQRQRKFAAGGASKRQFMSPREQAPGPRGSPQDPQGLAGRDELEAPFAETANTESCGSSFLVWHLGHSAFSLPYTKASNWWWHSLQMYS